jgi:hypothetical protein
MTPPQGEKNDEDWSRIFPGARHVEQCASENAVTDGEMMCGRSWNNKKEISCTMCWSLSCGFSLRKRDPSLVMRDMQSRNELKKNAPQAPGPSEKKDTPSEGIHPHILALCEAWRMAAPG